MGVQNERQRQGTLAGCKATYHVRIGGDTCLERHGHHGLGGVGDLQSLETGRGREGNFPHPAPARPLKSEAVSRTVKPCAGHLFWDVMVYLSAGSPVTILRTGHQSQRF
ncbi:hypothetical protein N658DRAFT_29865 [Parathielavia hyrcaniae]|uniref:Uncharacterized protein n=1 Tax=Parathielavia hyrcaniae TaxID=113614 RepID=A0AAN6QEJ7_9PEZI|nr:hypothetical protein N658DRAFT_29865 [Parathielavia hyrcaniae]